MEMTKNEKNRTRQEIQNDWFLRVLDWIDEHANFLAIVAVVLMALLIWAAYLRIVRGYGWATWTGLGEFISPALGQGQEYFRGKTLWDCLELLILPIVLAGGALLFIGFARRAEREMAYNRDQTERELAADRINQSSLQTYLDRMLDLILEKNLRASAPETDVTRVARALTLTAICNLDAKRKGVLVRFLYEAHLIDRYKAVVSLDRADLSMVDLSQADLRGVDLHGANLYRADLCRADLSEANLSEADLGMGDLCNADLCKADLSRTTLFGTRLSGADLDGANLSNADLCMARLSGARLEGVDLKKADLRDADLKGAYLHAANLSDARVSLKELQEAELDFDTTMPDGSKYIPPWAKDLLDDINEI